MLWLSYYVEDGFMHMIQTPNRDFWEITLHHMITAMLIFASYMNGFWNFGVLVLVQMDIWNISVNIMRMGNDYFSRWGKIAAFFLVAVTWFHFRFIAFLQSVFIYIFRGRLAIDGYTNVVPVIAFLLSMLLALNIYWFALFLKIGYGLMIRKQRGSAKLSEKKEKSSQPN